MLAPGDVLQHRYRIESLIGEGGMGRVYMSRQIMLKGLRLAIKEVALEGLHPDDRDEATHAIRREAETLAQLSHPNLVDVKDCFVENAKVYLVMEYVDGQTLAEKIDAEGPLPVINVIDYARQLCTVLLYLHNGTPPVIFKDLKPSNILLDASGVVRLIDFGLAQTSEDLPQRLLQGTPGYAPVEQLLPIGVRSDERSDIYALGATMYHLLSGRMPVDACGRLADDTVMPLIEANVQVPPWLSAGVERMMALRPEDRFGSVLEVRDLLDHHQRNQLTHLASVLPLFGPAAAPRSPVRVQAFLRDSLGRPFDVEIFDFTPTPTSTRLRFYCESRRWIRRPHDIYFRIRNQADAVRVSVGWFDILSGDSQNLYEVELKGAPLAVLRALRDAIRPAACLGARERISVRWDVEVKVAICEIDVQGDTSDVSESGCRMTSQAPLPLGRRMSVWLMLGDSDLPDVEVVAEVRWCRARWGHGYESGIVFTEMDEWVRDVLNLYFERCQQASLLSA